MRRLTCEICRASWLYIGTLWARNNLVPWIQSPLLSRFATKTWILPLPPVSSIISPCPRQVYLECRQRTSLTLGFMQQSYSKIKLNLKSSMNSGVELGLVSATITIWRGLKRRVYINCVMLCMRTFPYCLSQTTPFDFRRACKCSLICTPDNLREYCSMKGVIQLNYWDASNKFLTTLDRFWLRFVLSSRKETSPKTFANWNMTCAGPTKTRQSSRSYLTF